MLCVELGPDDDLQKEFDGLEPGMRVTLKPGVYRQKIEINTPNLTVIGSGAEETRIVYGDYAKKPDEFRRELLTFRTYTVAVCAPGVILKDLTIENDALHPEERGQEVALTVYEDDFSAERVRLLSTQDTLFLGPLPFDLTQRYAGFLKEKLLAFKPMRQIFKDCLIAGTVDFIFGCGDALFENCEIRSLKDARGGGYVAAPAHGLEDKVGFVFKDCRLTSEEGVGQESIWLARPWRDYGLVTFVNCTYGSHIKKEGFDKWGDSDRDKTARFYEDHKNEGRVQWSKEAPETFVRELLDSFYGSSSAGET
ncbi:MAG: pectin esterase [Lachnospiraceae bacterium]|nr:pectin esterase [Lachnospiraceae bacterium]